MDVQEVVLVSGCRTAIGDFLGSLKEVSARELAITAGKHAVERARILPDVIDEMAMGQVYSAMQGSLPARQVAMRIGLPYRSRAITVNQNCASGMAALEVAAHNIMLGKTSIALVVGVESMSTTPYLLPKVRNGYRMGPVTIEDHMLHDALIDELVPGHMAITAENVAEKYGIAREECDAVGFTSHKRALAAIAEGRFSREIIPVEVKSKKGVKIFDTDEHPIRDISLDRMKLLPTVFKQGGVVTAGNSSGINDGASAAVIMSKTMARQLGLKPLMKLLTICTEGVDPKIMGVGPALSILKALHFAAMKPADFDYWEIHEAFAAQYIGVERMLKEDFNITIDPEKINHNGSGIALGHPIGSSALRIIVSMYYEMERLGLKNGAASLCVGGGPSMTSLWTREI